MCGSKYGSQVVGNGIPARNRSSGSRRRLESRWSMVWSHRRAHAGVVEHQGADAGPCVVHPVEWRPCAVEAPGEGSPDPGRKCGHDLHEREQAAHDEEPEHHVEQELLVGPLGAVASRTQLFWCRRVQECAQVLAARVQAVGVGVAANRVTRLILRARPISPSHQGRCWSRRRRSGRGRASPAAGPASPHAGRRPTRGGPGHPGYANQTRRWLGHAGTATARIARTPLPQGATRAGTGRVRRTHSRSTSRWGCPLGRASPLLLPCAHRGVAAHR